MSLIRKNRLYYRSGTLLLPCDALWLKNAGATYQRLVNKMFKGQIRRNVEVYIDEMLVKSLRTE